MKTPTTVELYDALSKDLKSKLNLSEDDLRKVIDATSGVLAAQLKLLYLYLNDVQRNVFPDTADISDNGGELERLGRIYLNRDPNPATAGIYEVTLNGEPGAIVRESLTFKSNDDAISPGELYITDSEYILNGANDVLEIRSLQGGVDFLLSIGDTLTITEPVVGVDQEVTILSIIEQPKAAEEIDDYRQAILDSIQLEPQGGAKTDYRIWAGDAQGVRKVYPYVKEGEAGVVEIYVEATESDSTDGLGTPSTELLAEVLEVIEFDPDETKPLNERGRRPIQAIVESKSIELIPVDVDITGLKEDTTGIRNALEKNLKAYLRNVRPFIDGADLKRNKNDVLYSARLQSVVTDTLESSNFFTDFVMKVSGVDITSVEFSKADVPYLRTINYV